MGEVRLHQEAAAALLKEARRDFENGAHELHSSVRDESQRTIIEACVEIIGKLAYEVGMWPQEQGPFGQRDQGLIEIEFSPEALAWIERQRELQVAYIEELDGGSENAKIGYIAKQVYLLHVLRGIEAQANASAEAA